MSDVTATPSDKTCWGTSQTYVLFVSSWQQWKPSLSECPFTLLSNVKDNTRIIDVGFQTKTTLNRGWEGTLIFLFRGDGSMAQKLENRWICLNSFDQGCSFPSDAQSAVLQLCLLNRPIPSCQVQNLSCNFWTNSYPVHLLTWSIFVVLLLRFFTC